MERLKVLFVQSQTFFGSDSMIHSLIMKELDRDEVDVFIACNPGDGPEVSFSLAALRQLDRVTIIPMTFGPTTNSRKRSEIILSTLAGGAKGARDLVRLARFVRKNKIAIVHGTEKPRDAFYGYLVAKAGGARAVTHLHVKIEGWISPLTRWAMRRDAGLIAVSEFVRQSAIDFGYDGGKIFTAVNAIEADRWNPKTDGTQVRREFDIPDDVAVLSIISRLTPWKGHALLLDALALVAENGHDFRLLLVGEDDPRATPGGVSFTGDLKPQVERLGLQEQVIFTGWRTDVEALLAASDIYAMPTFEEPCAVAFLEAMAMGKAIVALDSGGTPEEIQDEESGLLSPVGDASALAKNIERLLASPEDRERLGSNALRSVRSYFVPPRLAADVLAAYRVILGSSQREPS